MNMSYINSLLSHMMRDISVQSYELFFVPPNIWAEFCLMPYKTQRAMQPGGVDASLDDITLSNI